MKKIKLLSTIMVIAFISLQVNAQHNDNMVNTGLGVAAPAPGIGNSKDNIRLDIDGAGESNIDGFTAAQRYVARSLFGPTFSETFGYLGYNFNNSSYSSTLGVSANLKISTIRALNGTSTSHGGQFTIDVDALSGTKRFEISGSYGSLDGNWNGSFSAASLGSNSYAGAVVGIDNINGVHTYGGYFEGKGYFSDNVGIGINASSSNLHVKNQGATNPTGASGNWAAKIENNVDTPGENGMFIANRWGNSQSTVMEAGSYWDGSAESYTPILTVLGSRQVGIGTNTPSSRLHVKNIGVTNPTGASGSWAAKVENNVDTPGQNGLFVANRWGTANESTVFEAGSYWDGTAESYTPILTVSGGKQVGIGTNTPSEKLTVNGNILFGDGNKTNGGESNHAIEWHTSGYGNGFGHKIYAIDPGGRTDLRFAARHNSGNWQDAMTIFSTGAVGIGTTDYSSMGAHKLGVDGSIICEELKVKLSGNWPDYVFGTKYNLKTIKELEAYIKENNHLPGVPAEAEVKENGIAVSEMFTVQLEKIEELTLYIINQEKQLTNQQKQIDELKAIVNSLKE